MAKRRLGALTLAPAFVIGAILGISTPAFATSPPVIDAVIPGHGPAAGGIGVQIVGSGFTGATVVAFGSTTLPRCTPGVFGGCFGGNGDNLIFANSPPGAAATTVDITVSVGTATSATNTYDKFTFDPAGPPVVSGVSPRSGPAGGGTGVQLQGNGFTGATAVKFGATPPLPPCPAPGPCFGVNGDNFMFAPSPPGNAGTTVDVTVTVGTVTSATSGADKFTYNAAATPVVDAVVPGHGTAAGGTGVQIAGSGFTGATQVAFGTTSLVSCAPSVSGPCFNVNSADGIFANSPPGTAGTTVDVTVTAAGQTSSVNASAKFTFDPLGPPMVSGVSPRGGAASGGTAVQILGSGFTGATGVAFGTTPLVQCTPSVVGPCFNVNGDGGIFANSPPGASGTTVDVTVTVGAVTSATGTADKFAYAAPGLPMVDAVVPGHGTAAGGTGVQIAGSGFTGATGVAFGSTTLVQCTPTVTGPCFNLNGDGGISANSPPGTVGPVDVRVTSGAGTSAINAFDTFTYDPIGSPVVSGVTPRSGPTAGGTTVLILGSGFTGATAVSFGPITLSPCGSPPCFTLNSDGAISAPTTAFTGGVPTVDVTVTSGGVTSAISTADLFTYSSVIPSLPIVDAVIPGHGTAAGGIGVQIHGSGFTGATAVAFGSTTLAPCTPSVFGACFNANGDNFISVFSPSGTASTTVDVMVTAGGRTSFNPVFDKFTFDPTGPPVVSGVSPHAGPAGGGTSVQILGSGFTGATSVAFGTTVLVPCAPSVFAPCFNANGDVGIFANSPPGSAGTTVDVTVTVGTVTSATSGADKFSYASAMPVVDAVIPGHGSAAGGNTTGVQIHGSGLLGATQVAFGTVTIPPCSPSIVGACFGVNGDNFIFLTNSPAGVSGTTVDVTVTAGGRTSAANAFDKFTFDPVGPPVVSGVSPRTGPATGGTGVHILGTGFTGATAVAFGTTTLAPCPQVGACFNVAADNGIFTQSPPGSAGTTVDVTVTVGAATSGTGTADKFTYSPAAAPVVDSVVPGDGTAAGGTNVGIHGSGFIGATAVTFGTTALVPCSPSVFVPCFNVNDDTGIFTQSPPGVGTVDVRVTSGAGTSAINAFDTFTYDPIGAPVVSGVSPRTGPASGGSALQILGSGFTGATAVAFGATSLAPCPLPGPCFQVNSDAGILAFAPPGTAGTTVDVAVTTPVGVSTISTADQFTYTGSAPPPLHTTLLEAPNLAHGGVPFTVTFIYVEANDGGVPVGAVSVTGSICGPAAYLSGDSNGNGVLDPGETWMFTCTYTFIATGAYTDIATATGTDTVNNVPAPLETASATVLARPSMTSLEAEYWRDHLSATGALLPLPVGNVSVSSTNSAFAILTRTSGCERSTTRAVNCLAAQLLAAELNVANDAANACIDKAIIQASSFLVTISYAGPGQGYVLTATQLATAFSLANPLDLFNGHGCPQPEIPPTSS